MNAYAKIRAALEMSKSASRYCALPGLERKADEALAALADLERAALDPVMWQYMDTQHVQIQTPPPSGVWRALYAAPPVSAGLVELREPSDDECRDIWRQAKENEGDGSKVCAGRAMFHAVSKWLKGEL